MEKTIVGVVFGLMGLAILLVVVSIEGTLTGLHYQTGAGDHTGYITSVNRGGIIFKTNTAYLKTNTTSGQEDAYCVIDPEVYRQLQEASVSGVHVNVHYFSWLAAGIVNCNGEDDVIDSVQVLPQ